MLSVNSATSLHKGNKGENDCKNDGETHINLYAKVSYSNSVIMTCTVN